MIDYQIDAMNSQVEHGLDAEDAYARLLRRARLYMWLHVTAMPVWVILALLFSAWLLLPIAGHWALASLYEQIDPRTQERIEIDEERLVWQLRLEAGTHTWIQRMREAVIWQRRIRENPWLRHMLAPSPFMILTMIHRRFRR